MCSSVVVSLLESDFLEAPIDDFVERRHTSVANCHPTAEPMKHCIQIHNQQSQAFRLQGYVVAAEGWSDKMN